LFGQRSDPLREKRKGRRKNDFWQVRGEGTSAVLHRLGRGGGWLGVAGAMRDGMRLNSFLYKRLWVRGEGQDSKEGE